MKQNEKEPIAVVYGGRGAEHEISCRSAAFILSLLEKKRLPLLKIKIEKNGGWIFDGTGTPTFPVRIADRRGFLKNGGILPVRCVLPVLHGDHGEDGEIQGLLEAAGIPYFGCGHTAGVLTSDKITAKLLAASIGIPIVPFCFSDSEDPARAQADAEETLSYPLFLKPASLGSSIGACAVPSPDAFADAYRTARRFGRVLIEEKVRIRAEAEVAYLGTEPPIFAGPGAVLCANDFYSFAEKYESCSSALTDERPDLPKAVCALCRSYAEKLVSLFGLRHLSRIDFFYTEDGRVFFNEINAFPGFTGISLYPKLLEASGIPADTLPDLFLRLTEEGGAR